MFNWQYGRPNDELTWEWLNGILGAVKRNRITLGPNSGLSMVRGEQGTALWVSSGPVDLQLANTNGTITARVATAAGTGTVFPVSCDSSGNLIVDTSTEIPVFNFSSTIGGIPTNTYVWITQDPGGNWFITAVDCGN